MNTDVISSLANVKSVVGAILILGYFLLLIYLKKKHKSLRTIVGNEELNYAAVKEILVVYQSDEARLKALNELLHHNKEKSQAIYNKIKKNVDINQLAKDEKKSTDKNLFFIAILILCLGILLLLFGLLKKEGAVLPTATASETRPFIEIRGKIKDNAGNGIKNAFAYFILNKDTIRSIPRLTGSDGSFAIRVDTSKNFSDYIYFGKDAFLDKKQISSFDQPELVINTNINPPIRPQRKSVSIEGITYPLAGRISAQLGLSLSSSSGIKVRFLAVPSGLESLGDELYRFNHGSKVQIQVGPLNCYVIEGEELTPTSTMGMSKSEVQKHIGEEINRIVANHINDIVKRIKPCIN